MGNCTGMAKPVNTQNTAKNTQIVAAPKSDTQTVLASKLQNQNNTNVKGSNLQAAQKSNPQSKVQVPQQAKSQVQNPNNEVGVAKQEPPAPPSQQPAQPSIKISKVVVGQQQPVKVQPAIKNSEVMQTQNVSWLDGSKTPANQPLKKSAVQVQNNSYNVAVSWMNVSHTPGISKVNASALGQEVDKNPRQLKEQNLLVKKIIQSNMAVIKEQQHGESSLSKPNSMNDSSNLLAPGSNGIRREDTSILLNKKNKNDEEQLGDIDQLLDSVPKYGGISISDIKISQLNSNINVRNSEVKNLKSEVRPITQQSKIEQQNAELISSRMSDPVNHEKLEVMNSLMQSEVVKYIEKSKIKDENRLKSEESFRIEEPGQLAQLESMMIPDQGISSPLKRISWKSQVHII